MSELAVYAAGGAFRPDIGRTLVTGMSEDRVPHYGLMYVDGK